MNELKGFTELSEYYHLVEGDKIIISDPNYEPFEATFLGYYRTIALTMFEAEHPTLGRIEGTVGGDWVSKKK